MSTSHTRRPLFDPLLVRRALWDSVVKLDPRPGREFTVTAYVKDPQEGQVVRLLLPEGFSFGAGHEAEKKVEHLPTRKRGGSA